MLSAEQRVPFFIWIPRAFTPKTKIEIVTTAGQVYDVSPSNVTSNFSRPATTKIGDFSCYLWNPSGKFSSLFLEGDTINFYGDLVNASLRQFKGRIDQVNERNSLDGQVLEIVGRHISFPVTEAYVTTSVTDKEPGQVVKDGIDTFLSGQGFTYANVETISNVTVTKAWINVPFLTFIKDVCAIAGCDFYIDDDKDFHFFKANTKVRKNDGAIEGNTLLAVPRFGKDTTIERNKVVVQGSDGTIGRLPIKYTAGTGNRVAFIINSDIETYDQAKKFAEAKLAEFSQPVPQGTVICKGLPFLQPGDNFPFFAPETIGVGDFFKANEIRHIFDHTGWRTEVTIEKEDHDISKIIRDLSRKSFELVKAEDPDNLNYSLNFRFSNNQFEGVDSNAVTNLTVVEGRLVLTSGQSSGTFTSLLRTAPDDVTKGRMILNGSELGASTFGVSLDGGSSFETVTDLTLKNFTNRGKNIVLKGTIRKDADRPNPQIVSGVFLYD